MSPITLHEAVSNLKEFDSPRWREEIRKLSPQELEACLPVCQKRLVSCVESLNNRFESKEDILKLMCICAIAQEPMLIFGPPGTAKSDLVARFAEGLGVRRFESSTDESDDLGESGTRRKDVPQNIYFEYLLNEYTEPDELLGPVVVGDLVKSPPSFRRFRHGALPEAHVVFLDEIFRGNSAILNALLSLINERRIYEAGKVVKANLFILFGAANHPPVAEDLSAFYERFAIRVISSIVKDDGEKRKNLLQKAWKAETEKLNAGYDPAAYLIQQKSCLNDLLLCNRALTELWGGSDINRHNQAFIQKYISLVTSLNNDKRRLCYIDDRKFVKLLKLLRAKSLFERMGPPVSADLDLLIHTWVDFESQDSLENVIRAEL